MDDFVFWILAAEIGRVDGYFLWWRWRRGLETGVLLLDLACSFDEGTNEGFGVAVYCCDDVWRDGLGDGLVGDLCWM